MLALEGRERYLPTPRLEGALRTLFARWPQRFLVAHEAPIHSISFSRDGALFATAATDGMRVLETASGRMLRNWRGATPATCVEFLADGSAFAVGWADGRVQIVPVGTDDAIEFRIGKEPIIGLAQSPDGAHLATHGGDSLAVIDLLNNAYVGLPAHPGTIQRARWRSADQLVTACEDGSVRHFDFTKGSSYPFSIPEHPVHDLAIGVGPAHEVFAAGEFAGLAVLDSDPPKLIEHLPFGSGSVLGLTASDDAERLVMQNVFGSVFVVDTASRKVVFERNVFRSLGSSLTLGPRGMLIGAGSRHGVASVTTVDPQNEQILAGHDGHVTAIAIDSTGRHALTAGEDRTVRLWDTAGIPGRTTSGARSESAEAESRVRREAGDVRLVLQDGEGPSQFDVVVRGQSLGGLRAPSQMVGPTLSPDGAYVFGAAIDRQAIYVFDSHRNEFIATLALEHNANGVYTSADGRWLVATWLDRVTTLEFPAIDELIRRVRAQLSRGLTDAERREFGIDITAPATAS
jgi:WD40 repeat protein